MSTIEIPSVKGSFESILGLDSLTERHTSHPVITSNFVEKDVDALLIIPQDVRDGLVKERAARDEMEQKAGEFLATGWHV
jgi:predicted transcriptional regulator